MAANITTNTPTKLKTAIIRPGERIILPQEAIIQSLVYDGTIDVNSSCNNLPAPSSYRCGYFHFFLDYDDNDKHAMDEKHTYLTDLKVGNNVYQINRKVIVDGDKGNSVYTTTSVLNTHVPDQALFSFTRLQYDQQFERRQAVYLYFKTVDSLFSSVELGIADHGARLYVKGNMSDCSMFEFGMDESVRDDILGPLK